MAEKIPYAKDYEKHSYKIVGLNLPKPIWAKVEDAAARLAMTRNATTRLLVEIGLANLENRTEKKK